MAHQPGSATALCYEVLYTVKVRAGGWGASAWDGGSYATVGRYGEEVRLRSYELLGRVWRAAGVAGRPLPGMGSATDLGKKRTVWRSPFKQSSAGGGTRALPYVGPFRGGAFRLFSEHKQGA